MAFADTAKLVVDLSLTGNFKRELAASQGALNSFNSRVTGGLGKLTTATDKARTALSKAGGQVKSLITGPVGMIGLTGVAIGLAGALSESVRKADEFGQAIQKVSAVTGDSVEETSKLVDTLDFYGVAAEDQVRVIGMAEKNLGELTKTTAKAADFQKDYGLSLLDASGKQLKFNDLLLRASDYFNDKHIPAATKAAGLAKIFGRNWQTLIPILSQGSEKLREMEGDAIKLTAADIENMKQFKDASRDWNDAIGDLQVTLGAKLLPELTGLARTASAFVRDHSTDIVTFFKDAWQAASHLAGILGDVGRGLLGVWNSIPEPMRDLLIKGIAADRTIKFLFGFSPIKFAADALGGLFGKLTGTIFQRGFVQPVFVTNQIPGGGGAPNLLPTAGAGLLSSLAITLGGVVAPIVTGAVLGELSRQAFANMRSHQEQIALRESSRAAGNRQGFNMGPLNRAASNLDSAAGKLRQSGKNIDDAVLASRKSSTTEANRGKLADDLARIEIKVKMPPIKAPKVEVGIEGLRGKISEGLKPSAKTRDIEAMRGKLAAGLSDTRSAAKTAGDVARAGALIGASNVVSAIHGIQAPITNVNVDVKVTAGGISKTVTTSTRYGPSTGSSGGDLGGPNGSGSMVHS